MSLNTISNEYGGYLISPVYFPGVDELVYSRAIATQLSNGYPSRSRQGFLPKIASASGMDWVASQDVKPSATITLDRDEYNIKELACTCVWSDRLSEESFSSPGIRAMVERALVAAASDVLDKRLWSGADTDDVGPDGVFSQSPAPFNTVSYGSGSDLGQDIRLALRTIRAANYRPNFIACHAVVLDRLQSIVTSTTAEPMYPTTHSPTPSIWGVPLVVSNNLPTDSADNTDGYRATKILVGDSRYLFHATMPSSLLISNVATVGGVSMYETDSTALRLTMNCSSLLLRRKDAFCAITDAEA
jgi:HK97 family phage major capsid protein